LTAYADTSFLFSLYIPDSNAHSAAAKIGVAPRPLSVSEFGEFEFVNALALRIFRKELRATEVNAVFSLFQDDVNRGLICVAPIPASSFGRAKQIARKYTPTLGVRALDVLHVASAVALRASTFYTFDRNQAKLAAACGLRVP
jgi:predicted nucleic acid-binding protein